jgi:hypothetical protein
MVISSFFAGAEINNFLSAGSDVSLGQVSIRKTTGGFQDNFYAQLAPRQL